MTAKLALLLAAKARHGEIRRCGTRASLWDGFIEQRGRLELHYNDPSGSTHMVWAPLDSPSLPVAPSF